MTGPEPEEPVGLPILYQSWRDVAFLHWAYAPATIASLLPPGFSPDIDDGAAWVTLTPFRIVGPAPRWCLRSRGCRISPRRTFAPT